MTDQSQTSSRKTLTDLSSVTFSQAEGKEVLQMAMAEEVADAAVKDNLVFDSEWRKVCRVKSCSVVDVKAFIRAHYLGKRPAIVLLALVMLCHEEPVGCAIYSSPPKECDKRYGGKTWELARLYILDQIPKNAETWLISQSVRWIKRNHPEVCNLVSYADPSVGHCGTIYKAANWREDGRTDDDRKTPRCDYFDVKTGKKYGRRGNMPADAIVKRRPRVSKYRFTLAIASSRKSQRSLSNA